MTPLLLLLLRLLKRSLTHRGQDLITSRLVKISAPSNPWHQSAVPALLNRFHSLRSLNWPLSTLIPTSTCSAFSSPLFSHPLQRLSFFSGQGEPFTVLFSIVRKQCGREFALLIPCFDISCKDCFPQHFTVKIFKCTENSKELYSEHPYAYLLDFASKPAVNI